MAASWSHQSAAGRSVGQSCDQQEDRPIDESGHRTGSHRIGAGRYSVGDISLSISSFVVDALQIIIYKTKTKLKPNSNSVWPNGGRHRKAASREENTKLRTRMAAKIALLSLLADELKHVVGSETTRSGLLNLLGMLQNRRLNRRLALVIFNRVLLAVLQVDSLTKHVR